MNKELACATAKWWRTKISNVSHDNGDSSCALAGLLADMLAAKNTPTEDQFNKFEEVLTKLLMKNSDQVIYLNCDYYPCMILARAAEIAEINDSVFPWKTNSKTTATGLYVSDGYAQPFETIYEINDGFINQNNTK